MNKTSVRDDEKIGELEATAIASRCPEGAWVAADLSPRYEGLPPPDPRPPALHTTCVRVAHDSGAAELLDVFVLDAEALRKRQSFSAFD